MSGCSLSNEWVLTCLLMSACRPVYCWLPPTHCFRPAPCFRSSSAALPWSGPGPGRGGQGVHQNQGGGLVGPGHGQGAPGVVYELSAHLVLTRHVPVLHVTDYYWAQVGRAGCA